MLQGSVESQRAMAESKRGRRGANRISSLIQEMTAAPPPQLYVTQPSPILQVSLHLTQPFFLIAPPFFPPPPSPAPP